MSSFLFKMEEKGSDFISPQFPAWLQSVQLQFLSGCFALGTQVISSQASVNYEMQHYTVLYSHKRFIDLIFNSLFNFTLMIVLITPLPCWLQTGTHSASVEKQQQLQSAAHTFYQQVVYVLKKRALVERERPGLFFSL